MTSLSLVALTVVLIFFRPSHAQEFDITRTDVRPLASDLDALAVFIAKATLTTADVRMVGAIGCSTMRVAIDRQFAQRIAPVIQANYPAEEQVRTIDIDSFIEFEEQMLVSLEVSEQARNLVINQIRDNPELPTAAPSGALTELLPVLEDVACDLRMQPAADMNQKAPPEESSKARWVGRCVVGLAVLAGDAFITAETGGAAAAILGIVSGGWGWNRCEESYNNIFK